MTTLNLLTKLSMATAGAAVIALGTVGIQANPAMAITLHTSDFITNSERTNFNGFEGLPDTSSYGSVYTEDGIKVEQVNGEVNDIWTTYQWWGAEGEKSWYPNGGDYGFTKITRQDNADIGNIGLLFGSGYWDNAPMTYAYNLLKDGVSVFSGTLFKNSTPNYLGFSDGGFNEVRLGAYYGDNPGQTLSGYQALAIDSIELKSVPEPASLMGILGLGAFGVTSLRKRKQATAVKA